MLHPQLLERRLQFAGALLISGLVIEALSVVWNRPIAFVIFVGLGGLLLAAGILLYLYSLVSLKVGKSSNVAGKTSDSTVRPPETVQPTAENVGVTVRTGTRT
jgi:hypothetical protein